MQQKSIDLVRLFKYSFQQYTTYLSFVIGIMVTYFVLAIIPQIYFMIYRSGDTTGSSQILSVVLTVVQLFLTLGFTKVMLLLVDDEFVEVSDLFNNFRYFLSYFVAYFLYFISVALGLLLFIVPGIWIAIRFQFYPYFILDDTNSAIIALQKSYQQTEGLALELFLFGFIVLALNILGILFFGIGIIFTYPLTTMATAILYRSLKAEELPAARYQIGT